MRIDGMVLKSGEDETILSGEPDEILHRIAETFGTSVFAVVLHRKDGKPCAETVYIDEPAVSRSDSNVANDMALVMYTALDHNLDVRLSTFSGKTAWLASKGSLDIGYVRDPETHYDAQTVAPTSKPPSANRKRTLRKEF